jgi:hypothetical protein
MVNGSRGEPIHLGPGKPVVIAERNRLDGGATGP